MYWDQVIGQAKVIDLLQRAVTSQRVAHAYLFHGPDGVGKRAAALALARALQCDGCRPDSRCDACARVMRIEHPDVDLYMPQPSGVSHEAVAERIGLLAENPYAAVDFVRAPEIEGSKTKASRKLALYNIDRINSTLRQTMIRRPRQGHCRMAIITDADALQLAAANAFLKLLEEPGPQTLFVLTTSRPDLLLPTILSRCQRIAFPALSSDDICKALVDRQRLDAGKARTVAIMADGSYSRALELAGKTELHNDRARILDLLRCAYTGNIPEQSKLVDELSTASREHLRNQLTLMLGWIRDLVLYREIQEDAPVLNQDQLPQLRRFCANLPDADLESMERLVQRARMLIEFKMQPRLVLTTLIQALGKAMRGSYPHTLGEPLTMTPDPDWVIRIPERYR